MILSDKPLFTTVPVEENQAQLDLLVADGFAIKASSIEELAQLTGMDNLEATITTYNSYVETGIDSDFNKDTGLIAFESDTFYAIKTYPFIIQTTDGIKSDINRQPLTIEGDIIEGVYVVGDMTGMNSITGGTLIGGAGLAPAVTTGIQVATTITEN